MTILSLIPNDLKDLLREIEGVGFSLCLVGGAPRDFLSQNILSHDLDFEIRGLEANALRAFLKTKNIPYTELPYQITRVDFQGFDLEFSTPRLEVQIAGNKTHHHFNAELNPKLTYSEAFKRRDFTLNAIGIELNVTQGKEVIVDPYGGVTDLGQKRLREISDDFFLDSVRFLRLIRFSIKYNFQINESIILKLKQFDLSELSKHHFIEEMMKSLHPGLFINKFNELVKVYHLSVSNEFKCWSEYKFTIVPTTKDDILVAAFLQKPEAAKDVSNFFSMPEKKLKDLKSFYDSWTIIKSSTREDFEAIVNTPVSDLKDPGLLKELKNLEDKKEWQKYFPGPLLISPKSWENIKIESSELESTLVQMRSYLRFYKAIQKNFREF